MNKRGQEYSLDKALRLALVILVAIGFAIYIYRASNEERINELKAIDFGLTLDSVFSLKDDISLNYDLGQGMNVNFNENKITMYKSDKNRARKEYFARNSNYKFIKLEDGKYENLFIVKEGNEIKVNDDYIIGENLNE